MVVRDDAVECAGADGCDGGAGGEYRAGRALSGLLAADLCGGPAARPCTGGCAGFDPGILRVPVAPAVIWAGGPGKGTVPFLSARRAGLLSNGCAPPPHGGEARRRSAGSDDRRKGGG